MSNTLQVPVAAYGSLRVGARNDVLSSIATHVVKGKTPGRLYNNKQGDYPVADFDGNGWIAVDVLFCDLSQEIAWIVDMEINAGYEIRKVWVTPDYDWDYQHQEPSQQPVGKFLAYGFHFPHQEGRGDFIPSGDWLREKGILSSHS